MKTLEYQIFDNGTDYWFLINVITNNTPNADGFVEVDEFKMFDNFADGLCWAVQNYPEHIAIWRDVTEEYKKLAN